MNKKIKVKAVNKAKWNFLFAAVLVCFAGIPIALAVTRPPATSAENCRLDGRLPAHTVVLIDQSDPFQEADVEWAWQLIFDEAQALRKHGRLTVMGINADNPDQGTIVFSRCSPGSPRRANPVFENPKFIQQDWEDKFQTSLQSRVADLILKNRSPVSPLIEHMRGIHRRTDFTDAVEERRIVLVSDLYQNSSTYSTYDSGLNQKRFEEAMYAIEFPNFEGVEVALFRVDRKRSIRGADLIEFWQATLGDGAGASVEVIRN